VQKQIKVVVNADFIPGPKNPYLLPTNPLPTSSHRSPDLSFSLMEYDLLSRGTDCRIFFATQNSGFMHFEDRESLFAKGQDMPRGHLTCEESDELSCVAHSEPSELLQTTMWFPDETSFAPPPSQSTSLNFSWELSGTSVYHNTHPVHSEPLHDAAHYASAPISIVSLIGPQNDTDPSMENLVTPGAAAILNNSNNSNSRPRYTPFGVKLMFHRKRVNRKPILHGNNRYGRSGRKSCHACRKIKRKVIADQMFELTVV
jgi:hypothetical protein